MIPCTPPPTPCSFLFITCRESPTMDPVHQHGLALISIGTPWALTTHSPKVLFIFSHRLPLFLSPAESNLYLWVVSTFDPFSQGCRSQDTSFHDTQEWHSSRSTRSLTDLENLRWPLYAMKAKAKSGQEPKQMEKKPFASSLDSLLLVCSLECEIIFSPPLLIHLTDIFFPLCPLFVLLSFSYFFSCPFCIIASSKPSPCKMGCISHGC